jgi:hypothetical protein
MTSPVQPGVKIAGKLPPADKNGLLAAAADLIDDPGTQRVVIAVLEVDGSRESYKKGTLTAETSIARIEVITIPDDLKEAMRLIMRAAQNRSGKTVLPLDTEKDIAGIFAAWAAGDPTLPTDEDGD